MTDPTADLDAALEAMTSTLEDHERRLEALESDTDPGPVPSGIVYGVAAQADETDAKQKKYAGTQRMWRVFFRALPSGDRIDCPEPIHYSFKGTPQDVIAGKHDVAVDAFLGKLRPDDVWTYFHEPEDDIEAGAFTAAQYRAAARRLCLLPNARRARRAFVFMAYTLNPKSGRTWTDYFAGDDVIDVMGWDFDGTKPKNGVYPSFDVQTEAAPRIAAEHGKPWVIAEYGSERDPTDTTGQGRADWMADYTERLEGLELPPGYVLLFDSQAYGGYPDDSPEVQTWTDISRA